MAEPTDTSSGTRSGHPIESLLHATLDGLAGVVDVPVWSLDAEATTRVISLAARVAAGVAEVEARLVGHAESLGLPGQAGCRDLARWLQATTAVTRRAAHAKVALAASLEGAEDTRVALALGEVHAEQALVIGEHLSRLDVEAVSAVDRSRAEVFLLTEARTGRHDARVLAGGSRDLGTPRPRGR